jgi:hypothetical protein
MAKLFKRGDAVAYQPKTDDVRRDGRSAAFYERGTTVPLKPLFWGAWAPLPSWRSAWRLRRIERNLNSKRLTCQRGGKIDLLGNSRLSPIDHPCPLEMLFRAKSHRAFSLTSKALRVQESPNDPTHGDHHLPVFNHGFTHLSWMLQHPRGVCGSVANPGGSHAVLPSTGGLTLPQGTASPPKSGDRTYSRSPTGSPRSRIRAPDAPAIPRPRAHRSRGCPACRCGRIPPFRDP